MCLCGRMNSASEVDRYDVAVGLATAALHVGATGAIESAGDSIKALLGHVHDLPPMARAAYLEVYLHTCAQVIAMLAEYAADRVGASPEELWRAFLHERVPSPPIV